MAVSPLVHNMPASISGRCWADCEDEDPAEASEAETRVKESQLYLEEEDDFLDQVPTAESAGNGNSVGQIAALLSARGSTSDGATLPSVGSLYHRSARCKPCAFFHTKGCENGSSCLFCHLCPPHEKQRRKRLREHMREQLGQRARNSDCRSSGKPPGHFRHLSGSSGTSSTCTGGSLFSHSRQSSGCSSIAPVSTPDGTPSSHTNANMCSMVPMHCGIVQPIFPLAPSIMQHMGEHPQLDVNAPTSRSGTSEFPADLEGDGGVVQNTSQTGMIENNKDGNQQLTLMSAAPIIDNSYQQHVAYGTPWAGQFGYGSPSTYIVPVPVPMQMQVPQHQSNSMGCAPYGCLPQQVGLSDEMQWQTAPNQHSSFGE